MAKEDYQELKSFGGSMLSTPMLDKFLGVSGKSDEEIAEIDRKEQEEKKQALYEKSGVSKMFYKTSLDTFVAKTESENTALQKTKNFIQNIKNGNCNDVLLFYGNFGTGKTHLGCSVVREIGGVYSTSFKLCVEYEGCSDFKSKESKLQMLERYSNEKLLVIDEIGRAGKENTEREILQYIISQRYENLLPTLLITNMETKTFFQFLGKAVKDRCLQCCVTVGFTGESKRASLRTLPLKDKE